MSPDIVLGGLGVVGVLAYTLLGGADFGGGVWDALASGPRKARQRDAIAHAMEDVKPDLRAGTAARLPYPDRSFDLVLSINTLHNLYLPDLFRALREIQRVGRDHKFIVMDSYRNEREKVNLLYWQLTCECFFTPGEWEWIFQQTEYAGDWDFVFFE